MRKFIPFAQWLDDNPDLDHDIYCGCQYKRLQKLYDAQKDEQRKKLKAWTEAIRDLSDAKLVNKGQQKEEKSAMRPK